jgi:hypothetical protein
MESGFQEIQQRKRFVMNQQAMKVASDAAAKAEEDGALEPAFLDIEGPVDVPPFITTTNAVKLFGLRPGETVAQAAARKATEG